MTPTDGGFVRGLFHGNARPERIFPFPVPSDEERETIDEIVGMVRDWAEGAIDPRAIDEEKRIPAEVIDGLKELGLFGLTIDERYEGAGLGQVAYARVMETVAHRCASTVTVLGAHLGIGMKGLSLYGTPEQKARWMPALASGEKLAAFALRSQSFRCRIRVNGKVTGSGALVSPRLVLTAEHVIATANGMVPKLEVEGPDDRRYPATVALAVPPHESEVTGGLPPAEAAAAHSDVALLRLDVPLGRRYAQVDLPPAPVPCAGKSAFVLVHFPGGKASGISFGEVDRSAAGALRQAHTAKAANGSSGGPGFDAEFRFLGLHQGRLGKVKRIVPFEQFCANADFRARIEGDRQMRYLWSLDGSPEGHLVIGRQTFFDALATIAAGEAPALRGIWVRRKSIAESAGLAFSHDLLSAFLDASAHRIVRLPTAIEVGDVVARLHAEVFAAPPPGARLTPVSVDAILRGEALSL